MICSSLFTGLPGLSILGELYVKYQYVILMYDPLSQGGPVVKTPCFHCRERVFAPVGELKIPHAPWCSVNK